MSSIGERIREERERLGYNQTAFGELGGVKKQAQLKYEKGERSPDADYLAAMGAAGVDVLYVLTGQRSKPVKPSNPREEALLDNYRHCREEDRAAIDRVALNAATSKQDVMNSGRKKTAS